MKRSDLLLIPVTCTNPGRNGEDWYGNKCLCYNKWAEEILQLFKIRRETWAGLPTHQGRILDLYHFGEKTDSVRKIIF